MAGQIERHVIEVHGRRTPAIVIPYSRGRQVLIALGSAVLAIIGLIMLVAGDSETRVVGGVAVLFFGGGAAVLARSLSHGGFVAFTADELVGQSSLGSMSTPWSAIVDVGRARIGRSEMVVVQVDDPSSIRASRSFGWLKGLNRHAGLPDLAFPTLLLGGATETVIAGVARYASDPAARARIGDDDELRALLQAAGSDTSHADEVGHERVRQAPAPPGRIMLSITGAAATLLAGVALLGDPEPGREAARATGVAVIGAVGLVALAGAWLLGRRPSAGRWVGLLAAAGTMLIGWIIAIQSDEGIGRVLVGIAVLSMGAAIAWRLGRWRLTDGGRVS